MLLNRDTVQWKKRREEKNGELLLKALKMTVWQCSIHSQILRSFSKKKKKSKNWNNPNVQQELDRNTAPPRRPAPSVSLSTFFALNSIVLY